MTYSTVEAKLKWTVFYEKFNPFLVKKKKLCLGPIWTGKNGFAKFFTLAKIFVNNVCPLSP